MRRDELRVWLADTEVSTFGRLVFMVLLAHTNERSGLAWPSVPRMAAVARLSERTVRRALRELEEAGEIETVEVRAGHSTRYRVTPKYPHPGHTRPPSSLSGRSQTTLTPVTDDRDPGHTDRQKVLKKDVKKARSDAPPQHGVAARTTAPSPVITRDDGATFLPGTGWVHTR